MLATLPAIIRPRKPKIYLRVVCGTLIPADEWAREELRRKRFKDGDIVGALLSKLRSKGLNRLVHKIGKLCVVHIEDFKYTDAHGALKRLQLEGNIACEEIGLVLPGVGRMKYTIPRSISFDSMDEAEFRDTAALLCSYISARYWPALEPEQIETMAKLMVDQV